jgi:Fe2+ or Zn2+ uptake regulation protein
MVKRMYYKIQKNQEKISRADYYENLDKMKESGLIIEMSIRNELAVLLVEPGIVADTIYLFNEKKYFPVWGPLTKINESKSNLEKLIGRKLELTEEED